MDVKRILVKCLLSTFKRFLFNPFEHRPISENKTLPFFVALSTLFMSCVISCIVAVPIVSGITDNAASVAAFGYVAAASLAVFDHYLFLYHKDKIAELLASAEYEMYRYERQLPEVIYTGLCREKNIKRLTVWLAALIYSNLLIALTTSVVPRILFDDFNTLLYPSWFPWNIRELSGYLCSILIQTLAAFYVSTLASGNVVFTILIYLEYSRQYKRLQCAISNISKSAAVQNDGDWKIADAFALTVVNPDKFSTDLIECIDHHRILKKNFEYFRPYFDTYFSFEFCACLMTLCLGLHALLEAMENGTSPMTIALLCHLLQGLLLKCYIGEKFSEFNDAITGSLYDLPWYEQTVSNRKLFHIFQMQTQRPYILKGLQVFPASLFIFAKVIKNTYSLLNIIRAS